jgi:hypothetical protein
MHVAHLEKSLTLMKMVVKIILDGEAKDPKLQAI